MAAVCIFNKFGHCKFKNVCCYRHVNTVCDNQSCDVVNCEKGYPRVCKYYRDFGRCKFSPCSFQHENALAKYLSKIHCLEKLLAEEDRDNRG